MDEVGGSCGSYGQLMIKFRDEPVLDEDGEPTGRHYAYSADESGGDVREDG